MVKELPEMWPTPEIKNIVENIPRYIAVITLTKHSCAKVKMTSRIVWTWNESQSDQALELHCDAHSEKKSQIQARMEKFDIQFVCMKTPWVVFYLSEISLLTSRCMKTFLEILRDCRLLKPMRIRSEGLSEKHIGHFSITAKRVSSPFSLWQLQRTATIIF